MLSQTLNKTSYALGVNTGAKFLFQDSVDTLMKSSCFDFMVYKVVNGNTENLSDYDCWLETIEIDKCTFQLLHLNLCQKLRRIIRREAP